MKLFISIKDPKGKLIEAFYIIDQPSEDATTDGLRAIVANTIKETLALNYDIDEEPEYSPEPEY